MALKDRTQMLTTPEQVDTFLAQNPSAAIFKAGTCHKTNETFVHVQAHLEKQGDIPLGIIKVVEWRPASNHVAQKTGVQHESPQIFLFKDGRSVFVADNWDISDESMSEGMDTLVAEVART
jgi:bacillithiol system protein YtxJ